jgi:hypothetical protein
MVQMDRKTRQTEPDIITGPKFCFLKPMLMREECLIMDLKERRLDGVEWIHLAQGRDRWRSSVNTVMNFTVP